MDERVLYNLFWSEKRQERQTKKARLVPFFLAPAKDIADLNLLRIRNTYASLANEDDTTRYEMVLSRLPQPIPHVMINTPDVEDIDDKDVQYLFHHHREKDGWITVLNLPNRVGQIGYVQNSHTFSLYEFVQCRLRAPLINAVEDQVAKDAYFTNNAISLFKKPFADFKVEKERILTNAQAALTRLRIGSVAANVNMLAIPYKTSTEINRTEAHGSLQTVGRQITITTDNDVPELLFSSLERNIELFDYISTQVKHDYVATKEIGAIRKSKKEMEELKKTIDEAEESYNSNIVAVWNIRNKEYQSRMNDFYALEGQLVSALRKYFFEFRKPCYCMGGSIPTPKIDFSKILLPKVPVPVVARGLLSVKYNYTSNSYGIVAIEQPNNEPMLISIKKYGVMEQLFEVQGKPGSKKYANTPTVMQITKTYNVLLEGGVYTPELLNEYGEFTRYDAQEELTDNVPVTLLYKLTDKHWEDDFVVYNMFVLQYLVNAFKVTNNYGLTKLSVHLKGHDKEALTAVGLYKIGHAEVRRPTTVTIGAIKELLNKNPVDYPTVMQMITELTNLYVNLPITKRQVEEFSKDIKDSIARYEISLLKKCVAEVPVENYQVPEGIIKQFGDGLDGLNTQINVFLVSQETQRRKEAEEKARAAEEQKKREEEELKRKNEEITAKAVAAAAESLRQAEEKKKAEELQKQQEQERTDQETARRAAANLAAEKQRAGGVQATEEEESATSVNPLLTKKIEEEEAKPIEIKETKQTFMERYFSPKGVKGYLEPDSILNGEDVKELKKTYGLSEGTINKLQKHMNSFLHIENATMNAISASDIRALIDKNKVIKQINVTKAGRLTKNKTGITIGDLFPDP